MGADEFSGSFADTTPPENLMLKRALQAVATGQNSRVCNELATFAERSTSWPGLRSRS